MEVLGAGFLIVMFFRSVDHHKVSKQGKADVAAISGGTRPELVLSTTSSSAFVRRAFFTSMARNDDLSEE